MSRPVDVEFWGGPWDGIVRSYGRPLDVPWSVSVPVPGRAGMPMAGTYLRGRDRFLMIVYYWQYPGGKT